MPHDRNFPAHGALSDATEPDSPEPHTAPAPHEHHTAPDHIPFLYGDDPLNPILPPPVLIEDLDADPEPQAGIRDPIPDPEPPSPSLPSPDPGIFEPGRAKPRS